MRKALLLAALLAMIAQAWVFAQPRRRSERARPPKFTDRDVQGVFFADIFSEGFQGPRPENLSKPAAAAAPMTSVPQGAPAPSGDGWSQVISSTTIEDEIKAIKLQVDSDVMTEQQFISRGYEPSRRHFGVLAMLFGVIAEYDGDVRFKEQAPAARDVFARSSANCKVGTTQSFNEAKKRKADLQELLSGGAAPAAQAEPNPTWGQIADREPLMERLEIAQQTNLQPWIGSEAEFKSHLEEAVHEAELVAAIAEVLRRPGMTDAEDETYAGFSKTMHQAALDIVQAVKTSNYEQARKAVGVIDQACSQCHETYRE